MKAMHRRGSTTWSSNIEAGLTQCLLQICLAQCFLQILGACADDNSWKNLMGAQVIYFLTLRPRQAVELYLKLFSYKSTSPFFTSFPNHFQTIAGTYPPHPGAAEN